MASVIVIAKFLYQSNVWRKWSHRFWNVIAKIFTNQKQERTCSRLCKQFWLDDSRFDFWQSSRMWCMKLSGLWKKKFVTSHIGSQRRGQWVPLILPLAPRRQRCHNVSNLSSLKQRIKSSGVRHLLLETPFVRFLWLRWAQHVKLSKTTRSWAVRNAATRDGDCAFWIF